MDKSAIEQLQKEQAIVNANNAINELLLDEKLLALPESFNIHSLEKHNASRWRFRGQLETKSIDAFASYATNNAEDGAATFIDADAMKAKLVINLGSKSAPGHCDHYARVSLEKSAPYLSLLAINDTRKSQKEIAEFIEDWRNFLTASSEENEEGNFEPISIIKALHAVRKITIEAKSTSDSEQRTFGASSASMESIDVKSLDMPPAFFHFTVEPYLGLSERIFTLRLSVITDRVPVLVLRIVRFEEHKEQMAKEFQAVIENRLQDIEPKISTYVGNFTA
jgi:uncharacterized protein YfdQ (DUF2303 family)